jgi:arsenate reductase
MLPRSILFLVLGDGFRPLLPVVLAGCLSRGLGVVYAQSRSKDGDTKKMLQKTKILILCTGNSARSQMAEGLLKSLDPNVEVYSAGTHPSPQVNPSAVRVMKEIGIDVSSSRPKNVSQFLKDSFDYVITVCDDADQNCPSFTGHVKHRLHIGFADPARAAGSPEEILVAFRTVRDEIRARFSEFWEREVKSRQNVHER